MTPTLDEQIAWCTLGKQIEKAPRYMHEQMLPALLATLQEAKATILVDGTYEMTPRAAADYYREQARQT